MYRLSQPNPITGKTDTVFIVETGLSIPMDKANTDYQAYLKWVEEGNTPLPADEVQA